MEVTIRMFAQVREAYGASEAVVTLPAGSSGEQVWDWLAVRAPQLAVPRESCRLAINQEFADFAAPLSDGDEVVILTPVAGG